MKFAERIEDESVLRWNWTVALLIPIGTFVVGTTFSRYCCSTMAAAHRFLPRQKRRHGGVHDECDRLSCAVALDAATPSYEQQETVSITALVLFRTYLTSVPGNTSK